MTVTLKGLAGSPGLTIGTAFWWKKEVTIHEKAISNPEEEISRLEKAITTTEKQIRELHQLALERMGQEEAAIFEAHLSFLEDPSFTGEMKHGIAQEKKNAEAMCEVIVTKMYQLFQSLDDEYMQARAEDIRDVGNRILENLINNGVGSSLLNIPANAIVIAEDLTPSDTMQFSNEISGIVTAKGNKNSHAAIIARTLGIPAVFGLQQEIEKIQSGDTLFIDGEQGLVSLNPSPEELAHFEEKVQEYYIHTEKALSDATEDTYTSDGTRIPIFANIGHPRDIEIALANHAEGVGLFRTEFLYLENDHWPTEEEQFQAYKQVLRAFSPKPVLIRTLDIGGDKQLSYANLPIEENPYLGCRGIRYCLKNTEIFKTQLRALLRASTYGELWILLPMIENKEQIHETKRLLEECQRELEREDIHLDNEIKLGIMIEIPAAALTAESLAKEVNFFSIGTNDLTQYTLAADRGNEWVHDLYDETHPAVLQLIHMVCIAAQKEGIPVGVCGELASNLEISKQLIRMGVKELSVTPLAIPKVKQQVRKCRLEMVEV